MGFGGRDGWLHKMGRWLIDEQSGRQ